MSTLSTVAFAFVFLSIFHSQAGADSSCVRSASQIINETTIAPFQPLKQLRRWEQTSNREIYKKPTDVQALNYSYIDSDEIDVNTVDIPIPESLKNMLFDQTGKIRWIKHPRNQSDDVPYLNTPNSGSISGEYSASRSMFIDTEGDHFTFKLPTDRPMTNSPDQPTKADLRNDSILSIRRSKHINEVNALSNDPFKGQFLILTELLSVSSRINGNGFSVRDLRPLQDGNYYLPAFAIPYAGIEIAKKNGKEFKEFWGEYYVKLVAEAKAILAIHYGLQMKTPNAQNWLIQLDQELKPTGKIIMRDVADSSHIDFIAPYNGARNMIDTDLEDEFETVGSLHPNFSNSVWMFDVNRRVISQSVLSRWRVLHERTYVAKICEMLGIENNFSAPSLLAEFLKTDEAQILIRNYAARNNLLD